MSNWVTPIGTLLLLIIGWVLGMKTKKSNSLDKETLRQDVEIEQAKEAANEATKTASKSAADYDELKRRDAELRKRLGLD